MLTNLMSVGKQADECHFCNVVSPTCANWKEITRVASLLISIRDSIKLEVSGTDTQLNELCKRRCYYLYSLGL